MIVFIISIYDKLKTQIWYFSKNSGDALFFNDNMLASAVDKVVTLAGEVCSKGNSRL